jgi:uncharacterized protein (UPF0305 family)
MVNRKVKQASKPGISGLQTIYLSDSEFEDSLYDHESQMSQSELCCVCKKLYPEKLKECDLTIANWSRCMFEGCLHWVHLHFCCEVRVLRTHSVFYCPCQATQKNMCVSDCMVFKIRVGR